MARAASAVQGCSGVGTDITLNVTNAPLGGSEGRDGRWQCHMLRREPKRAQAARMP